MNIHIGESVQGAHKCENKFSMEQSGKWQFFHFTSILDIMLEIKVNEKVTETKHSQIPINGANIYFTIKTTVSLHISSLWSLGQKILPGTRSASPSEYNLCTHSERTK